jgi:hypothetical protein
MRRPCSPIWKSRNAAVGAVDRLRDVLLEDRALRQRVDDHERRLVAIETRVG